jgi:hypothetical protein
LARAYLDDDCGGDLKGSSQSHDHSEGASVIKTITPTPNSFKQLTGAGALKEASVE